MALRNADKEYSDAERVGDCDFSKTLAKTNLARKLKGRNGLAIQRFGKISAKYDNKFKSLRKERFRTDDRRNFSEKRQAGISETACVRTVGDVEHRRAGLSPGGAGWGGVGIRMF